MSVHSGRLMWPMPICLLISLCIDPDLTLHVRLTLLLYLNDDLSVASLGKLTEGACTVVHAHALVLVSDLGPESGPRAAA